MSNELSDQIDQMLIELYDAARSNGNSDIYPRTSRILALVREAMLSQEPVETIGKRVAPFASYTEIYRTLGSVLDAVGIKGQSHDRP